ncbi:hypothetical protein F4Z99_15950 [Candidatus Poribacteria bacterium]|nr:hypothetical protein [Candidatus Poribacteria bacterium]
MNFGLFLGVIACILLVWYLYRRSQDDTSENAEEPIDNADDDYEDLLLTGLMLNEVYDDDEDPESSDDVDSGGYDDGYEDPGGFE